MEPLIARGDDVASRASIILNTFRTFGVELDLDAAFVGRTAMHIRLKPTKAVRMKKIEEFTEDIRFAVGAKQVNVLAPLPGTKLIEVTVYKDAVPPLAFDDLVTSPEFKSIASDMTVLLGKDELDKAMAVDVRSLPHLLVGGKSGSGKSMLLQSIICQLLLRDEPESVQCVLLDSALQTFRAFEHMPHIAAVTHTKEEAVQKLEWLISEMERRFGVFKKTNMADVQEYHMHIRDPAYRSAGDIASDTLPERMPYLVCVIDDLAELFSGAKKVGKHELQVLLSRGGVAGIHIIAGTSVLSARVLDAAFKALFTSRGAFAVTTVKDSRFLLDSKGAERLHGEGALLFLPQGSSVATVLQAPEVTMKNIAATVTHTA